MSEEMLIKKAKYYLVRLKNNKQIKNRNELLELKKVIEELDSISYQIKIMKGKNNCDKEV
jgi:hypothetical protein